MKTKLFFRFTQWSGCLMADFPDYRGCISVMDKHDIGTGPFVVKATLDNQHYEIGERSTIEEGIELANQWWTNSE